MNREQVLNEARKCVCGQRDIDYGTPENNFNTIAQLWTTYLKASHPAMFTDKTVNSSINAADVAIMMGLMKIARIASGSTPDSYIDLAGYAACAGELATNKSSKAVPAGTREDVESLPVAREEVESLPSVPPDVAERMTK